MKYAVAALAAVVLCSPASARPHLGYTPPDRHDVSPGRATQNTVLRVPPRTHRTRKSTPWRLKKPMPAKSTISVRLRKVAPTVVAHPAGCPRTRFCGCGVSLRVYGERRRNLYLAANWLKFPAVKPAPGMVAARRGRRDPVLPRRRQVLVEPRADDAVQLGDHGSTFCLISTTRRLRSAGDMRGSGKNVSRRIIVSSSPTRL